jgi:hypothetical protein
MIRPGALVMTALVRHRKVQALLAALATAYAGMASAQAPAPSPMTATEAQMRYERRLAECNVGTLAAPDRATCVRNAGTIFDSERAGLPTPPTVTTNDGRATVVRPSTVPAGAVPAPDTSTTGVTSTDGRATVIVPSVIPQ